MINNNEIPHVVSVKELLRNDNLAIPEYQRPYKWTAKNVKHVLEQTI